VKKDVTPVDSLGGGYHALAEYRLNYWVNKDVTLVNSLGWWATMLWLSTWNQLGALSTTSYMKHFRICTTTP